jgi:tetratricopeptide (TPR) repeat protein
MEDKKKNKKLSALDWFELGKYHSSTRNSRNAINAYQKCLKKDPNFYQAWVNISAEYFQMKKYHDSIDACKKAINIHPGDPNSWLNIAANFFQLNEDGRALFSFQRASELGSKKAQAFLKKAGRLKDKLLDVEPIDVELEILDELKSKTYRCKGKAEAVGYKLMSLHCPECGGSFERVKPKGNKLKCRYCEEEFEKKVIRF